MENEANNILKDKNLIDKIFLIKEEFEDDILEALKVKDFKINFKAKDETGAVLCVVWSWKSRALENVKEIERSAQSKTLESFINEVKSYFFDLTIMLLNL